MRIVRRLLGVFVFVAVLAAGWQFAAKNPALVTIDLLLVQFSDIQLWTALGVTFGSGAALASLVALN